MAVVGSELLSSDPAQREADCCRALEEGNILLFRQTPFELTAAERAFLIQRRQTDAGYHKNIAYRPSADRVTGVARQNVADGERLRDLLRAYSQRVVRFTAELLPRYAASWRVDYASFRPQEEAGRKLARHARNDLLHVDSFPTRPTRGDRIFRVFTNVNPEAPRVWRTGETFPELAQRFAEPSGLLARATRPGIGGALRAAARSIGAPVRVRPPYDEFMHRFHNYLKDNEAYQESARAERTEFAPGSTWMVFTDMVTHSVLSGQFALEQTFLIARDSLMFPANAPVTVLERLAGRAMV
jgi:3-deoxy-D-manno-octulosonic acid hydroxylase-like protein